MKRYVVLKVNEENSTVDFQEAVALKEECEALYPNNRYAIAEITMQWYSIWDITNMVPMPVQEKPNKSFALSSLKLAEETLKYYEEKHLDRIFKIVKI